MKNSHLKNSLIAAGIAVFAGVVTLGANVAIGATTPTQSPATAGLVGPTFSGLDVYGDADIGGDLTVSSSSEIILSNPVTDVSLSAVNGALKILGDTVISHILTVNAAIDAQSYITNTKTQHLTLQAGNIDLNGITTLTKDLSVNGSTILNGDLDVQAGLIKNSTGVLGFGSVVNFAKNAIFNGDTNIFYKGLQIDDGLWMGGMDRTIRNVGQINGDDVSTLRLQQPSVWMELKPNTLAKLYTASGSAFSASNTGTATIIGSNIYGKDLNNAPTFTVTGKDFASAGEVKAATWLKTKDFQSTGALWSDGSAYFKNIDVFNEGVGDIFMENGNIRATGDLTVGKNVNDQKFLVHTRPNGNGDFLQITTDKADGNWDWSNGIIMKRATAEGSPSTQFHVNGKVTSSNGFGTYTFRESIYKTLGANAGGYVYASCNAGEKVISCYGNAYSSVPTVGNFSSGETYDVNMTALYPYNGQCEANYKNTTGSNRYIKSGALCLNPSL